ncbi:hypothetical protein BC828DRAFT_433069 [Blastocladiella britannica]|nr:hypothetical protein BC828DRAFT_433069 [Blastocladiella britannica]
MKIDDVLYIVLAHAAGTVLSPEEALLVLNVLPRHSSVLAAALSSGFKGFSPALVIKHGRGLDLLPHHPSHVLFDGIYNVQAAAAVRSDIPTIELLWQLAGPSSPARTTWFEESPASFVRHAIKSGKLPALEWVAKAAQSLQVPVNWSSLPWVNSVKAGHTGVANWAIARGYLLKELVECPAALLSTRGGNSSAIEWWIAQQPSKEVALSLL